MSALSVRSLILVYSSMLARSPKVGCSGVLARSSILVYSAAMARFPHMVSLIDMARSLLVVYLSTLARSTMMVYSAMLAVPCRPYPRDLSLNRGQAFRWHMAWLGEAPRPLSKQEIGTPETT